MNNSKRKMSNARAHSKPGKGALVAEGLLLAGLAAGAAYLGYKANKENSKLADTLLEVSNNERGTVKKVDITARPYGTLPLALRPQVVDLIVSDLISSIFWVRVLECSELKRKEILTKAVENLLAKKPNDMFCLLSRRLRLTASAKAWQSGENLLDEDIEVDESRLPPLVVAATCNISDCFNSNAIFQEVMAVVKNTVSDEVNSSKGNTFQEIQSNNDLKHRSEGFLAFISAKKNDILSDLLGSDIDHEIIEITCLSQLQHANNKAEDDIKEELLTQIMEMNRSDLASTVGKAVPVKYAFVVTERGDEQLYRKLGFKLHMQESFAAPSGEFPVYFFAKAL